MSDEPRCPNCGARMVKYTVSEHVAKTEDRTSVSRKKVFYRCDECNIDELDPEKEIDPIKIDKRRELRGKDLLTDLDIKRIRKKLGLTQEVLAQKLGVAEKTFARYESLGNRQGRAMDNLLRILEAYPDAINILKGKTKAGQQK